MIECAGEGASFLAPRSGKNLGANLFGGIGPVGRTLGEPEQMSDARETVASDPAHGRRMRMNAQSSAIFPYTRVRLQIEMACLLSEIFEIAEETDVSHPRQPLVDEHLRGAENDAAVGVMLQLIGGKIAEANRPHPLETLEIRRDLLRGRVVVDDAVNGLQRA